MGENIYYFLRLVSRGRRNNVKTAVNFKLICIMCNRAFLVNSQCWVLTANAACGHTDRGSDMLGLQMGSPGWVHDRTATARSSQSRTDQQQCTTSVFPRTNPLQELHRRLTNLILQNVHTRAPLVQVMYSSTKLQRHDIIAPILGDVLLFVDREGADGRRHEIYWYVVDCSWKCPQNKTKKNTGQQLAKISPPEPFFGTDSSWDRWSVFDDVINKPNMLHYCCDTRTAVEDVRKSP